MFKSWLVLVPLFALAALALLTSFFPYGPTRQFVVVAAVVLLIFEFIGIGVCISGNAAGAIIDARNCMSLSKLQACAWTVLILSAVLVAAASNLSLGDPSPLGITIPSDLLVAMGISATSLAVTPALLSLKTDQTPSLGALTAASAQLTTSGAAVSAVVPNIGSLMTNVSITEAHWTDMLTGDEVGNFASPDLGKIQQLLVTVLLIGVYAAQVIQAYAVKGPIHTLPTIDQSFIWLLGVSHAGYLAYKAAPHTTT